VLPGTEDAKNTEPSRLYYSALSKERLFYTPIKKKIDNGEKAVALLHNGMVFIKQSSPVWSTEIVDLRIAFPLDMSHFTP
jgi:hypothetical protein